MIRALAVFTLIPAYMVIASMLAYPVARFSGSPAILYSLGRLGIRVALFLAGTRVVVEGGRHLADTRNTIFMANHASLLDAPIVANLIQAEFKVVAKKELFRVPFFGACLRLAGFIEVDRSDRDQATRAIRRAVDSLLEGHCFLVFPEGTRSPNGELGLFKKGVFHVALEAKSRIVPVALQGVQALMPKGSLGISPGTVRVRILDPIEAGGYSSDRLDLLIEDVRGRIFAALSS
jgi:1-acyl-sn-glycerol-3-phosphate acyltransferase